MTLKNQCSSKCSSKCSSTPGNITSYFSVEGMATNFGVEININKTIDRMVILVVMSCQKMVTQSLFFDSLISSRMVKNFDFE